jgi:hypothetical protein
MNQGKTSRFDESYEANELQGIRNWVLNEGEGETKSSKRL